MEKINEIKQRIRIYVSNPQFIRLFLSVSVVVISSISAISAHASTSNGSEFSPILQLVTGWIMGVPGILAAIAIVLTGLFMALSKGVMSLFVALIIAGAIFTIPAIVTGIATTLGGAIF